MNFFNTVLNIGAQNASGMLGGIRFTTENLPQAMSFMLRGMAGIFISLFVIYLFSIGLQKLFREKPSGQDK